MIFDASELSACRMWLLQMFLVPCVLHKPFREAVVYFLLGDLYNNFVALNSCFRRHNKWFLPHFSKHSYNIIIVK